LIRELLIHILIASDATWNHFMQHDAKRGLVPLTQAIEVLEASGYVDSFAKAGLHPPPSTVWSGLSIVFSLSILL
jgi:hypothetical protein